MTDIDMQQLFADAEAAFAAAAHHLGLSETSPQALESATRDVRAGEGPVQAAFIDGLSGVGTSTVMAQLETTFGFKQCMRCFTRPARPNERQGIDVLSMSEEEFLRRKENGEFVFTKLRNGVTWHGILVSNVRELIASGQPFVIERSMRTIPAIINHPVFANVDWTGIYLIPPAAEEWVRRLEGRVAKQGVDHTKNPHEDVAKRLVNALADFPRDLKTSPFQSFVVNDEVERAAEAVARIIRGEA